MFGGRVPSLSNVGGIMSNINTNYIIIAAVAMVLIGVAAYFYFKVVAPKLNPSYVSNKQPNYTGDGSGQKEAEFMLFYVDWCPHCKTAKPEWEKVKEKYQGKTVNGYTVVFKDINCTNETPEVEQMISQYKIEGYPTIKLVKDGQVIDFDSKPTQSSLEQFLNSVTA
jgi:thiol-disulfide isomerase/thioredoxin